MCLKILEMSDAANIIALELMMIMIVYLFKGQWTSLESAIGKKIRRIFQQFSAKRWHED